MKLDLTPTYAELYERALWTLVEIDHGLHGELGRQSRASVSDEALWLKEQAFRTFDA
mgnify:CR=1 FL=1